MAKKIQERTITRLDAKPDWIFLPDWIQSGTGPHARLLIPIWGNRAIWTRLEPIRPDCFDSGRIKQNTAMEK